MIDNEGLPPPGGAPELVKARSVWLVDGRTVFARAGEINGLSESGVDVDDDEVALELGPLVDVYVARHGNRVIQKVPSHDLEPGMFWIDRAPTARDDLDARIRIELGNHYKPIWNGICSWKNALSERISLTGLEEVAADLSSLGCRRAANPQNVRNWATWDVVSPQWDEDFRILVQYLGMDTYFDRLLRLNKKWVGVCHQIGQDRRSRINQEIVNCIDPQVLRDRGFQEGMILPAFPNSPVSVYRIESVSDEAVIVPTTRIGVVTMDNGLGICFDF